VAGAGCIERRKAEQGAVEIRKLDVAIERGKDAALITDAGGTREEGTVGKKLVGRTEELDAAATVSKETVEASDAALNNLGGDGRGKNQRVGAEGDAEADGTADEVIGRGTERWRQRVAGGGETDLVSLSETDRH